MLASWLCFLVATGASFRYLTTLMKWTTLETQEMTGSGFRERKTYESNGTSTALESWLEKTVWAQNG